MTQEIINNRYQIIEKIGAGGTGEVYKVEDLKNKSILALKLISQELTSGEDLHRFKLEFYAVSKLNHPNIIKVHDYGETADKRLFFTMEYLDGCNIRELFEEGVDFSLLYSLIVQLCDGLSYLHSEGLIHSDIKPENVKVTGKEQTVKLLDFSLVGPIDISVPKSMIKGTLPYIAPECLKRRRVDGRSDLYSLGVLLYELVTGIQPFKSKEPIQIIRQHIEKKVKPPSQYNSDIPEEFEKIILRLIEKRPENRYGLANELARDIGRIAGQCVKIKERRRRLLNPTFVGREAEFNKLKKAYQQTKKGKGLVVLISGETGIGKTKLLQELRFAVQLEGSKCMVTRCVKPEDIPYKPFVEPIKEIIEYLEPNNINTIRRFGPELIRIIPELAKKEYMKGIAGLPKLPAKSEILRLFDYITGFLTGAARRLGPMVILIHDMHLAGKESIDFLGYLARNIKESKLLVCVTYRSEEVIGKLRLKAAGFEEEVHPLIALRQAEKKDICEIELDRLDLQSTNAVICSMMGVDEFEPKAVQKIFDRTAGNPLFIQAMMNSLTKEGIIAYEDMQWTVNLSNLKSTKIPEQVERIIRVRLGKLTADTLEQLSIAAVIGKEFSLDILRELGERSASKVYKTVKDGIGEALIEETRAQGRLMYDFTHPLIRELLYGKVESSARKVLHRKIGKLLEKHHTDELESVLEQLAYHYSQGGNKSKAIRYLSMAGDKARQSYSNDDAISYYEEALQLMRKIKQDGERPILLEKLGDVYELTGSYEQALDRYEKSYPLISEQNDLNNMVKLLRKIGNIFEKMGKYDNAIKSYESGIAMIVKRGVSPELSRLHERMGRIYSLKGEYRKAIELCERSLKIAVDGRFLEELAFACNTLGNLYRNKGEYDVASDYLQKSLAIRKTSNPYDLVSSYSNLGLLHNNRGEWRKAVEYYDKGLKLASKIGDIDGQAMLYNNLGITYKNMSKWDESKKC